MESYDELLPIVNEEADDDLPLTYCFNCDKNCVIELYGYTQCVTCKHILVTDVKQIRRTYVTKAKTNKINNFTKALNEFLLRKDPKFYAAQQIVDIFSELVDFITLRAKPQDKLHNINAKFFIEKILTYLGLIPEHVVRKKYTDNERLWCLFTLYKYNYAYEDDFDINPPQCGVTPIKCPSLRM